MTIVSTVHLWLGRKQLIVADRRQREKQEKLKKSAIKESRKEFDEEKDIPFGNINYENENFQVSGNMEMMLQVTVDKERKNEEYEIIEEVMEEIEEVMEEIETVMVKEDGKDVMKEKQIQNEVEVRNYITDLKCTEEEVEIVEELMEEIEMIIEEDKEKEKNGLTEVVKNQVELGQTNAKEYEIKKNLLLQEKKQLFEVVDTLDQVIVKEKLIDFQTDKEEEDEEEQEEETITDLKIDDPEADEEEEIMEQKLEEKEMKEIIWKCDMASNGSDDEIEYLIENEEQIQEENKEKRDKSNVNNKFKNVKILNEFTTHEREISMMTHVINDTLKKVVVENNHKRGCLTL
ncbi:DNA ligase 1-like [Leptopilina boulardi]|uniref:DNA ligase 1-like n=1 Tax=Leptopilina boulardi TaxID=63433 RepID=UPI0021F5D447|nr:DNA ligase 1-like [Leptopilina boulardi]